MSGWNKLLKLPGKVILSLNAKGMLWWVDDKTLLKMLYRIRVGKKLNLKDPKTYNEKLQWIKLYDRNPLYTVLADKYAVRQYVADKIGQQYLIPLLGVWEKPEDIDFDTLPDQFVLKCNHDSGGVRICKNKQEFDRYEDIAFLKKRLKRNGYISGREWPYKNIPKKIIAEQYMEDMKTAELRDYKFFTFDGKVKALFVAKDRQKAGEEVKFDYFDENYNLLPFRQVHEASSQLPEKPECFEQMKELAEKLATELPYVRVDFYEVNGKIFFGELTFFHHSGLVPFYPEQWDAIFGSWINLPEK